MNGLVIFSSGSLLFSALCFKGWGMPTNERTGVQMNEGMTERNIWHIL